MNAREKAEAISQWLGWQHEDLSFGLRSLADAEKLYDYWKKQSGVGLPELADEESDYEDGPDVAAHRVLALGYDPLVRVA